MRYAIGGLRLGSRIHTASGWITTSEATSLSDEQRADLEGRGLVLTPVTGDAPRSAIAAEPVDLEAQARIAEQKAAADADYALKSRVTKKAK